MAAPKTETPRAAAAVSSRWFIPVGAVLVHICIGSVYGWSTFNRPIDSLFPDNPSWFRTPYINYTTALVLLGLSAAFGGNWVERQGPRRAAVECRCSPRDFAINVDSSNPIRDRCS